MGEIFTDDELLTVGEVAGELKIAKPTISGYIHRGILPYIKIGRHVRIKRSDLEKHLAEHYHPSIPRS